MEYKNTPQRGSWLLLEKLKTPVKGLCVGQIGVIRSCETTYITLTSLFVANKQLIVKLSYPQSGD